MFSLYFIFQIVFNKRKMKGATALLLLGLVVAIAASKEEKKEKEDIGTVIGIDLGTTYSW